MQQQLVLKAGKDKAGRRLVSLLGEWLDSERTKLMITYALIPGADKNVIKARTITRTPNAVEVLMLADGDNVECYIEGENLNDLGREVMFGDRDAHRDKRWRKFLFEYKPEE